MAHEDRRHLESPDDDFEVLHDRGSREALDGRWIAVERFDLDLKPRIGWSEDAVASRLVTWDPVLPASRRHPEAVNQHDRVGTFRWRGHGGSPWSSPLDIRVPLLHLVECYILDVVPDVPPVAERIAEDPRPLPVELVLRGALDHGAGRGRAVHDRIGVIDVEVDGHARSFARPGSPQAVLRELVRQHQDGVAEGHLGVPDSATWLGQTRLLLGAERRLVELDRLGRIFHAQVREQLVDFHGVLLSGPNVLRLALRVLDEFDLVESGTCKSEAGAAARYSLGAMPAISRNSRLRCGWS